MITLSNISYSYGDKIVLSHLDTQFEDGGFYAIMGANGCGKTTLLRLVAGLLAPQEGAVMLDDTNVRHYSARQLAQRMAFVRQHPHTDFEFSAFETVLMGRNPSQRRLQNESEHI